MMLYARGRRRNVDVHTTSAGFRLLPDSFFGIVQLPRSLLGTRVPRNTQCVFLFFVGQALLLRLMQHFSFVNGSKLPSLSRFFSDGGQKLIIDTFALSRSMAFMREP